MTVNEVSTVLRALEAVIVKPDVDETQRTSIIKAVFAALLPSERKLKDANRRDGRRIKNENSKRG